MLNLVFSVFFQQLVSLVTEIFSRSSIQFLLCLLTGINDQHRTDKKNQEIQDSITNQLEKSKSFFQIEEDHIRIVEIKIEIC